MSDKVNMSDLSKTEQQECRERDSGVEKTERQQAIMDSLDKEVKIKEMVLLLIECRDALPAITLVSAKLRGLDLSLADRIEDCLEPWKVADGEDGI